MAGNRRVTCAEGCLSLVRETDRVRIDFDTSLIAPALTFILSHSGTGTGEKAQKCPDGSNVISGNDRPHILWQEWIGTTSNCVILRL